MEKIELLLKVSVLISILLVGTREGHILKMRYLDVWVEKFKKYAQEGGKVEDLLEECYKEWGD